MTTAILKGVNAAQKTNLPRVTSWSPGSWDWNQAQLSVSLSRGRGLQRGGRGGAELGPFPLALPWGLLTLWAGKGRNETPRHICHLGPSDSGGPETLGSGRDTEDFICTQLRSQDSP